MKIKLTLEVNDFVILIADYIADDITIERNSVGLITSIKDEQAIIYFIGKRINVELLLNKIQKLDVLNTGKPYKVKICNVCHILKDDSELDINQTDAKGRKTTRPSCKKCRVLIDGVKLKTSESKRLDKTKPKYLFTCPICEKTSIVGITANIVKDHDHKTGMAREWICDSCNTGLGRFRDDESLLMKVLFYLNKHKNQNTN